MTVSLTTTFCRSRTWPHHACAARAATVSCGYQSPRRASSGSAPPSDRCPACSANCAAAMNGNRASASCRAALAERLARPRRSPRRPLPSRTATTRRMLRDSPGRLHAGHLAAQRTADLRRRAVAERNEDAGSAAPGSNARHASHRPNTAGSYEIDCAPNDFDQVPLDPPLLEKHVYGARRGRFGRAGMFRPSTSPLSIT